MKQQIENIIITSTYERYFPIRLYYDIQNISLLKQSLRKLKCVYFSSDNEFMILYLKEAKRIDLPLRYKNVPDEIHPVILAQGLIIEDSILHLDVKSFERAIELVQFIAQRITSIKITAFANYNRIPLVPEEFITDYLNIDYDQLFSDKNMHIMDIDPSILNVIENKALFFQNEDEINEIANKERFFQNEDEINEIFDSMTDYLLEFDIIKTPIIKNGTFENAIILLTVQMSMINKFGVQEDLNLDLLK